MIDALARGVEQFNNHEFWHAHESWEHLWLASGGERRTFLQGLIQLTAAYHHVQRGTYSGGVRLFDAAFEKLDGFVDGYGGIDRSDVIAIARRHRDRIAENVAIDASEYPKLSYNQTSPPPNGNVA